MPILSAIGQACARAFGMFGGTTVSATYLVVAGGGAGGAGFGNGNGTGGGGAGGLLTGTTSLNPATTYVVTVGAGGFGSVGSSTNVYPSPSSSGSNSSFSSIVATGGGAGGSGFSSASTIFPNTGNTGGSGGGGYGSYAGGAGNTPSTSPSQGNNGGAGYGANYPFRGGGGGGSGSVGADGVTSGNGGSGTTSSITGTSVTYAGGGGAGCYTGYTPGSAGASGAGAGGANTTSGTSATPNTGSGGGGGGWLSAGTGGNGGNGGSGIVVISYPAPQKFGGGVVTTSGGNIIHTFTTSGSLTPLSSLSASYLIVAGGGGGGGSFNSNVGSGGGGAGGLLSGSGLTIDTNSVYVVTVGAGGAGAVGGVGNTAGTSGASSAFSMVSTTAVGGGYGSWNVAAGSGGSGGGATDLTYAPSATAGSGTSGQGYAGANATIGLGTGSYGGGGGGAGAVGGSGSGVTPGTGGVGVASSISGTSTYYAGGGGGGTGAVASSVGGSGGNGGGGAGGYNAAGSAGTVNTGGGGGGAGTVSSGNKAGGAGGSGVVIISYPGSTQQMAGGTVTIVGGNVIHTFTSSGYLTPIKYVNNSLRFRSSASAYLNRTFGTPTDNLKWTWSGWAKLGAFPSSGYGRALFSGGAADSGNNTTGVFFNTSNQLYLNAYSGGANQARPTTNAVYRDPAAWYHIVCVYDSANAIQADRFIFYVNGVRQSVTGTLLSLNLASKNNASGVLNRIGMEDWGTSYGFDGYMTEVNFVDGQALPPTAFGTFNSYGVWQPITYGGSYGTNGFYLPFTNNASTTTLGYDFSPNGNNWTCNNISLTAGVTYDSMTDVPTLTSATAANYCVLNPLQNSYGVPTITNGNLSYSCSGAGSFGTGGSIAVSSGKWYWEINPTALSASDTMALGIREINGNPSAAGAWNGGVSGSYIWRSDGFKRNNGTSTAYGTAYTTSNVIGVALDMDAGTLTFYKDNSSPGTAYSGLAGTFQPAFATDQSSGTTSASVNFGQRPFTYTPPTGFVALNTYNM
jgi:hypothetical protein